MKVFVIGATEFTGYADPQPDVQQVHSGTTGMAPHTA
jgi:hypothetical protein